MSVVKLTEININSINLDKQNFFMYNSDTLKIQTEFQTLKPYGLQKQDKFHESDQSRMIINIPLMDNEENGNNNNFNILNETFKTLIGASDDNYISIIKNGRKLGPYLKLLFSDTINIIISENGENHVYEFTTLQELEKQIKPYYKYRFIIVPKAWKYNNMKGVSLYINSVQIKREENPFTQKCCFIG